MVKQMNLKRALRDGEMLCRFDCGTIVSKELKSCELCCPAAIAEREARLEPIIAAEKAKNEEKTKKLQERLLMARLERETEPKGKGRRGA